MGKKFASENAIKKVMDLSMKLFPNNEITSNEVNDMWNEINGPIGGSEEELAKWNYTLDDVNNTVNLSKYIDDTATDVTVFDNYTKGDKTYKTKITSANQMFSDKTNLKTITFNPGIDSSECTIMSYMFYGCRNLKEINGLENLDTSNVTIMTSMFSGYVGLISLDLTEWDTSKVTDMNGMFYRCNNLKEIKGLENWDVSNVTNMSNMFSKCKSLVTLNLTGWDTSNVTSMFSMFYECTAITSINGLENLNTSNVTSMSYMFGTCKALTSLNLTSFDTSKVTGMYQMFVNCTKLTKIQVSKTKWVIKTGCDTTNMFDSCGVSEVTYVD